MKQVPVIRFEDFTDVWEQRKLGECFAERTERSADGELIAVTINSGVVKASELNRHDNSSEDKSNYKVVRKNDIAYNSMRMWQGASGFSRYDGILSPAYTVLIPKEGVNSHFFAYMFKLYYMIHEFEINSQGLTKDTWNLKYPALSPISIFMPKYEEQTKIADYFEKLDNLITLHQRKCDKLLKFKSAMLGKFFPKKSADNPEIRFEDFTDAWEQRKVGELTVESSEYATLESDFPLLTSSRNGLMYQNEYRGKQTTDSTETMFSIVPLGACTYRHMSDDDVFHLNVNRLEKGLVSREYPVFYASDDNNLDFIVQQINSSAEFRSFCAEQKKGGTRTRLYYKNLCEFQMLIPNTEEQEKIATFLLTLDSLITLHQRKLEKLKQFKAAMLEKMFV